MYREGLLNITQSWFESLVCMLEISMWFLCIFPIDCLLDLKDLIKKDALNSLKVTLKMFKINAVLLKFLFINS